MADKNSNNVIYACFILVIIMNLVLLGHQIQIQNKIEEPQEVKEVEEPYLKLTFIKKEPYDSDSYWSLINLTLTIFNPTNYGIDLREYTIVKFKYGIDLDDITTLNIVKTLLEPHSSWSTEKRILNTGANRIGILHNGRIINSEPVPYE